MMLIHNAGLLDHPSTELYLESGHAIQLDAPERLNEAPIKFMAP